MKRCFLVCIILAFTPGTVVAAPLNSYPLRPDGIGLLKIGMTKEEAEKATGLVISLEVNATQNCDTGQVGEKGPVVMIEEGKITRISLTPYMESSGYATLEGARLGDSEDQVIALYKAHLNQPLFNRDAENEGYYFEEFAISHYTYDEFGHYFKVQNNHGMGYMLETDGKKITHIHAGKFPSVAYVEGCL